MRNRYLNLSEWRTSSSPSHSRLCANRCFPRHTRFCRARSPCLRSSTARSYQNKNAGWLARLIRVHHLAGKRLGSVGPRRSFNFYRWLLTLPTRGPPAPFAARGSSSLPSRHDARRLGLPRATPRNRVPSGTAEIARQPRASRSEDRESDRSVKPSIPHLRMYLSWPLSPSDSGLHRPASSDLLSVCNRSTVVEREEHASLFLNSAVAMVPQNAERVEDNHVPDRQFLGRNHNFVGVADNWIKCLTPALVVDDAVTVFTSCLDVVPVAAIRSCFVVRHPLIS